MKIDYRSELESKLKEFYDDKDYIGGVISNSINEIGWKKILDFIRMAERNGDKIIASDILLLSVIIGDEIDPQE